MQQGVNKNNKSKYHFLSSRIQVTYLFAFIALAIALTFLIAKKIYSPVINDYLSSQTPEQENSDYQIKRLGGYKLIQPLVSAKPVFEFDGYADIKESISELIQLYKEKGIVKSASVYLRDFDKSNWIAVNKDAKYFPGSILKVPLMITILKYDEDHPGHLSQKINYNIQFANPKKPNFLSKHIEFRKTYTRRELLQYMIEYSDNEAAELLLFYMDKNVFVKMFDELGLPKLDLNNSNNPFSAVDCSLFFEILFNATYLTPKNSEYAIELLTKSTFVDGIVKGIPNSKLLIAHKFGEAGTDKNKELHETALLYIENKPYLITIMTRGMDNVDFPKLATVIQDISRNIYEKLIRKNNAVQ